MEEGMDADEWAAMRMSRKADWVLWFLEDTSLSPDKCGNVEWEDDSENLIKLLRGMGTICRGMKYSAVGWAEVGDHTHSFIHSFISQILIEDLLGLGAEDIEKNKVGKNLCPWGTHMPLKSSLP